MAFVVRHLGAFVIAVAAVAPVAVVWTVVAPDLALPWADDPMTPSQAIVRGDLAQAIRLIESGAPVNGTYASPTSEQPGRRTTPMDEAIRSGKVDLVRALLDLGGAQDAEQQMRYACDAHRLKHDEIAAMIMRRPLRESECAPLATPSADMVNTH